MVLLFVFAAAAVVVLVIAVYSRTPERAMVLSGRTRWARCCALILAGVYAAFWLLFAVGEMAGGEFGGVAHLFPAVAVLLFMLLARKRPDISGEFLAVLGAVASVYFFLAVRGGWAFKVQAVAVAGAPILVSGVLFLISAAPAGPDSATGAGKPEKSEEPSGPVA